MAIKCQIPLWLVIVFISWACVSFAIMGQSGGVAAVMFGGIMLTMGVGALIGRFVNGKIDGVIWGAFIGYAALLLVMIVATFLWIWP